MERPTTPATTAGTSVDTAPVVRDRAVGAVDDWLLSVRDLCVHFDTSRGTVEAVDGVSFDLRPGETLALVGETGCGKSVTARSLMRLVPTPPGRYPTGSVLLRERDGDASTDLLQAPMSQINQMRGDRIAMIFQDPGKALNPSLTIRRQVGEVFGEHRWRTMLEQAGVDPERAGPLARRVVRQRGGPLSRGALRLRDRSLARRLSELLDRSVERSLAETGIPNPRKVMSSYPHELSGGMKQRVMIAQALACDPDLLIADEPTTALDVTIQARILNLIADLQARSGTAVLYITHDLSLVRQLADRLAVMYAGRIAEIGPVDDVLARPLHPYTAGLLAAIPHARTGRGELAAIPGTVPQLVAPPPQCHFHTRCSFSSAACGDTVPILAPTSEAAHAVACLRYPQAGQRARIELDRLPAAAAPSTEEEA
ncbi:ABC transporter ATP-binding protein [Nocardioides pyridinolyticus]